MKVSVYGHMEVLIMDVKSISTSVYQNTTRTTMQDEQYYYINPLGSEKANEDISKLNNKQEDKIVQENQRKEEINKQFIKSSVTKVNKELGIRRTKAEFNYNEKLNRISIKIYDETSGEVIREIPPEKTLEMVEKMLELAGLLFDERI